MHAFFYLGFYVLTGASLAIKATTQPATFDEYEYHLHTYSTSFFELNTMVAAAGAGCLCGAAGDALEPRRTMVSTYDVSHCNTTNIGRCKATAPPRIAPVPSIDG